MACSCRTQKLEAFDITIDRGTAQRLLNLLVDKFTTFARQHHGIELVDEEAEALLLDFVSERTLPLLRSIVQSMVRRLDDAAADWFVVASFVTYVYERDPEAFQALSVIVKGSMFPAVVSSPTSARCSSASVTSSSSWTLRCCSDYWIWHQRCRSKQLGISSTSRRVSGPMLRVSSVHHAETVNVLSTCCDQLRSARRPGTSWDRGRLAVVEHCLTKGIGPSDLWQKKRRLEQELERDLQRCGVRLVDSAPYDIKTTIDEAALEAHLQGEINYPNPSAATHDVQCISAVHTCRGSHRNDVKVAMQGGVRDVKRRPRKKRSGLLLQRVNATRNSPVLPRLGNDDALLVEGSAASARST